MSKKSTQRTGVEISDMVIGILASYGRVKPELNGMGKRRDIASVQVEEALGGVERRLNAKLEGV